MSIITNDPMIEKAKQAAMMDQQAHAVAKQIELSVMLTAFTQFAMAHSESGADLSLEIGRAMAKEAVAISGQYSGFILEAIGLAKMEKSEPKMDVMTQEDVDNMLDKP